MPAPNLSKSKKNIPRTKKIKDEHIDRLVEELLGGNKKLTKAQQHKKRELEDYLEKKIRLYHEKSDDTASSDTETEDSESGSESSCDCLNCCGTGSDDDSVTCSSNESKSDSDEDSETESDSSDNDTETNSSDSFSDSDSGSDFTNFSDEFTDYTTRNFSDDSDY